MKFNLLLTIALIILINGFNFGKVKEPVTYDSPFKDEMELMSKISPDEPSTNIEDKI